MSLWDLQIGHLIWQNRVRTLYVIDFETEDVAMINIDFCPNSFKQGKSY